MTSHRLASAWNPSHTVSDRIGSSSKNLGSHRIASVRIGKTSKSHRVGLDRIGTSTNIGSHRQISDRIGRYRIASANIESYRQMSPIRSHPYSLSEWTLPIVNTFGAAEPTAPRRAVSRRAEKSRGESSCRAAQSRGARAEAVSCAEQSRIQPSAAKPSRAMPSQAKSSRVESSQSSRGPAPELPHVKSPEPRAQLKAQEPNKGSQAQGSRNLLPSHVGTRAHTSKP